MNSAEDELEATLWLALTRHKVTVNDGLALMTDLVAAAVAYAASDSEALTAARRMVLHEVTAPGPGQTSPRAWRPEEITMSTGPSIPPQVRTSRPQPVDNLPVDKR